MRALHRRKLVTVVCETALERHVLTLLRSHGADYTLSDVRGGGSRGERGGDWEGRRSVEIKVICDEATAERIVEALLERYSADYALTLWVIDALAGG
jgi:hypothetical protein